MEQKNGLKKKLNLYYLFKWTYESFQLNWNFFSRNILKGVQKKYRTRSFRFFEKIFGANIIQKKSKTENYTDERYRFGWTLNSKFYVREQIFWAKGESARLWFGIYKK